MNPRHADYDSADLQQWVSRLTDDGVDHANFRHNFALQMAKPVITIVDLDHLTAVIFSSRIWFPDSILRYNAGHQSARCYIEGWV